MDYKKTYVRPESEVIELKSVTTLLAGSFNEYMDEEDYIDDSDDIL